MSDEVVWTPEAESELATIWLGAVNRRAVAMAADRIDRELGWSPLRVGVPRISSVNRVAVFGPLGLAFEVIEEDKRVLVQRCLRWADRLPKPARRAHPGSATLAPTGSFSAV